MFADRSWPGGTLAYVAAVQPLHERLQAILTQTAGYSLLVLTRGTRLVLFDAPVITARDALATVLAQLAGVHVPARARPHHDHTSAASRAIKQALDGLLACLRPGADEHARTALTRSLRVATDELRIGTKLLPGFAMADLSQACCAAHAVRSALICQNVEG